LKKKSGVPLLSYHADGKIRLWNVSRAIAQVVAEISGRLPLKDPNDKPADITSFTTDPNNDNLFCGDSAGIIQVRSISKLDATAPSSYRSVQLLRTWAAHTDQISALAYVDNHTMIISASADTSLRMWTLTGDLIGTYGSKCWNLRAPVEEPEPSGTFFITGVETAESKKKEAAQETTREEDKEKLPKITSAEPRGRTKEPLDRSAIAEHVVKEWLDEKRGLGLKFDPDKREDHRGVAILEARGYKEIPYLHRHMSTPWDPFSDKSKVGVAFPEMKRYGKMFQDVPHK